MPATTPSAVFATERYDNPGGPDMSWHFPLAAGQTVEVRLYFASNFEGASRVGDRQFDVTIDSSLALNDYHIVADVGHRVAVMKSFIVTTDSNGLDILFQHTDPVSQNPLINAIEILIP